jgi:hypothetical protein
VHFVIDIQGGVKEALAEAKKQAKEIFDYKPGDEKINVSVKETKVKEE